MSGNFLYFNYIKPGTRYYELPDKVDDHTDYILDLPSEDWEIVEFTNWRFYSNSAIRMQDQGWKIHISATTETAEEVLKRVGEILFKKNIAFKHIANEEFLKLMNSKHGNRASAGKFMAIYPDDNIFPILLDELHECLKGVEKGPYILSDREWKDGNVYYRYGGFKRMVTESGELAIKDNTGKLVPDNRTPYYRVPDFVTEPEILKVECEVERTGEKKPSKLSQYKILRALRFNNGGGIYLAENKDSRETVVIKEARPKVGYDGNGHDAEHRLNIEHTILDRLKDINGIVKVKDYFKVWENTFLVEEFVEGIDLTHWVSSSYPFHQEQDICNYLEKVKIIIDELIRVVRDMHNMGVGMGDLQPSNIIVNENLKITLIDFEASHDLYSEEKPAMMTVGFAHIDNENYSERDWYGIKRILKYCVLPIGPVEVLDEKNKVQQDLWIHKICGQDFYEYYKNIEIECDSHLNKTREKNFSSNVFSLSEKNIDDLISGLRMGIETNYDSRKSLIKGDIRQFEMECGNTNVLVGGFGAILALTRTGALDEEAQKWMENFVNCEYGITDEGLFTGMSGIASVLYENGYTKEACKIFDKLKLNNNTTDITLRSGMSGIALALSCLYESENNRDYLDAAINMAFQIKNYITQGGEIKVKDWAGVPIGLIDGFSGVSLLYSKLFQLTGDCEWYDFANKLISSDLKKTKVTENLNVLQSLDGNMRLLPYVSGGSIGIGISIWFLNSVSGKKHFEKELGLILNLSKLRCTFSAGLFDGMGSLVLIPTMMDNECKADETTSQVLEKLKMYLIYEKDKGLLCPGNFSYRLSEDIFSGSSGIMLALQGIKEKNPMLWFPLVGMKQTC